LDHLAGLATRSEKSDDAMHIRPILFAAVMLAFSAKVLAAPSSAIGSESMTAQRKLQPVGDCVKQTDCRYRWLRCGKGWCRGPFDPFGGGSIPKVEMQCVTTVEPCASEQPKTPWEALFGRSADP